MSVLRKIAGLLRPDAAARSTVGRNDPCWCGSGKKYKRCHLEADERRAQANRSVCVSS